MKIFSLVLLALVSLSVEANSLKILSWNVFMLPKPVKYSLQLTRTKHIIEELKKLPHEIVVLQEAFDQNFQSKLRTGLRKIFPHRYYLPKKYLLYPVLGSGVLILSRIPFKILETAYYDSCGSADCLASKGVALLEFVFGAQTFQLAATHMQSGSEYVRSRRYQFLEIKRLLSHHRKPGVAQLLIGDLNVEESSDEFTSVLNGLEMMNLPLVGDLEHTFGEKNECYKTEWGKLEWIDHMLFSPNGSGLLADAMNVRPFTFQRRGKTCALSDHLAIEGDFYFPTLASFKARKSSMNQY